VIHTPGHASNHLCYLLEEEKLLFTGDHVMQGSPWSSTRPTATWRAYLRGPAGLLDEDLDWLAPGPRLPGGEPHAVLRALIAHRLRREAKVSRRCGRVAARPRWTHCCPRSTTTRRRACTRWRGARCWRTC
jgi:glyoxylase-like metal-dependent hydrolase (beta-lactamase superfamily II)